jgi:hypothetical protein
MSNKEKFVQKKAEAQKANADAHTQEVMSGKKFRITSNPLLRK